MISGDYELDTLPLVFSRHADFEMYYGVWVGGWGGPLPSFCIRRLTPHTKSPAPWYKEPLADPQSYGDVFERGGLDSQNECRQRANVKEPKARRGGAQLQTWETGPREPKEGEDLKASPRSSASTKHTNRTIHTHTHTHAHRHTSHACTHTHNLRRTPCCRYVGARSEPSPHLRFPGSTPWAPKLRLQGVLSSFVRVIVELYLAFFFCGSSSYP